MPSGYPTNMKVTFPPAPVDEEVKIQRFLKTLSEFMGVELEIKTVSIISVEAPPDRQDVMTILNKLVASKKNKLLKLSSSENGKDKEQSAG